MKTLFTCLSKNVLCTVNGSGMERGWIENGSVCSRKLFASIIFLLLLGVGEAWGGTQSFSNSDITASNTSATKTPITVSIGGAVTIDGQQIRFSSPMTVSASGVYKISEIAVTTNSTNTYIAPLGNTVSSGTWSGSGTSYSWSGDAKSVVLTPNSAIRITGITVIYYEVTDKYTASFDAGSGSCATSSLKEATPAGGVQLPTPTVPAVSAANGWVFAGWKQTSAQTSTLTAPTLYAAGAQYYPEADETLYAVYKLTEDREDCTVGKINAIGDLAVGDYVVLIYDGATSKIQYCGLNGNAYGDTIRYTTSPKETHLLEVQEGSSSGKFAFYDVTDKNYLYYSGSSNSLGGANSVTPNSSWTVTISSGDATITNVAVIGRTLQYNSDRFACYSTSQKLPQLYKMCPPLVTYNSDCVFDYFVDIMHGNEIESTQGSYSMPSALSDASKGEDTHCDEKHYHFLGWVEESDINENGTLKADATIYPAGDAGHTANNKTYYAIWAKEE